MKISDISVIIFILLGAGLIIYFYQYHFSADKSDESWIFPFIWSIPCSGIFLGILILLSSSYKYDRLLCLVSDMFTYLLNPILLPLFAIPLVLLLLFVMFIFFQASQDTQKQQICNASSTTQDSECVVTKDGQQICGHDDIRELCQQLTIGFYLIIMGAVLMSVAQVF